MAARKKAVETVKDPKAEITAEDTAHLLQQEAKARLTPAQMAAARAYNEAYLAEVRAASALGPIDGQRLVQAHYRARTALKADIAVSNHVCPMCGGQPIAV